MYIHVYLSFFMKGKKKLASLVPALIHDILLNEKRGIPLRIEVSVHYYYYLILCLHYLMGNLYAMFELVLRKQIAFFPLRALGDFVIWCGFCTNSGHINICCFLKETSTLETN